MPFDSLASFIQALDSVGELRRVQAPVSPILEIAEITDRQSKSRAHSRSPVADDFDPGHADLGGHALLFENVEGSDFPVAINLWGSYRRMETGTGLRFRIDRPTHRVTHPPGPAPQPG